MQTKLFFFFFSDSWCSGAHANLDLSNCLSLDNKKPFNNYLEKKKKKKKKTFQQFVILNFFLHTLMASTI
jgi:hypothetical protein